MNSKKCRMILSILVIIFSIVSSFPIISGLEVNENDNFSDINIEETILHLLRVEHYLYLKAEQDTNDFNVNYALPTIYGYQAPILVAILDSTDVDLLSYKIQNDIDGLNKIVNFSVGRMNENEIKLLHFTCWVLVEQHDFEDLPSKIKFPKISDLPDGTKTWLVSTPVVQVNSLLIKTRARILKGLSNNVLKFANKVAGFIKNHRYLLFILQIRLGIFISQDAITTLFFNGENVGRSHLACALFRSQNIPARVLLVNNDQGFWTQMHYMVEYYLPDYGWVLLDSTKGKTPYSTKRQVINRICFPEDENDTKTDYIFDKMKGEERWIWVSDENVQPYYVDCTEGSKSQMFSENVIETCNLTSEDAMDITKQVFLKYQQFLGSVLSGENLAHFQKAIDYQNEALDDLNHSSNPYGFIYLMGKALEEYDKIIG